MLESNNPVILTLLERGYRVSVQLHVKPGGPAKYMAMAKHMMTGKSHQGWGPSAGEAVDDLRVRAGILADAQTDATAHPADDTV